MQEQDKDLAKELNQELQQIMQNLFLVLDGQEETKDIFFQGDIEGHFFGVTGDKSELERKALKCGAQLMFGILESSNKDLDEPVRDYTIIGLTFEGSSVDVLTGPGGELNDKLIISLVRDYPGEFIFLAIEMPSDVPYIIEGVPKIEQEDGEEKDEDLDFVEIYINKAETIRIASN